MAVLLTVLVGAFRVGGSGELEMKKDIENIFGSSMNTLMSYMCAGGGRNGADKCAPEACVLTYEEIHRRNK